MDAKIEQALREAATAARIVDADLVTLPVFEEIVRRMASEKDATRAVAEMQQARPKLFLHDDFAKMESPEAYAEAETRFRERFRKKSQAPVRSNEFRALDAVLLSETEQHALRRYLGGTRNFYDLSILNAALTRQNGPKDAA